MASVRAGRPENIGRYPDSDAANYGNDEDRPGAVFGEMGPAPLRGNHRAPARLRVA